MSCIKENAFLNAVLLYWRFIIIVLTPIVFIFIPILMPDSAGKCAYCIAIMAIFWMTEVIPIAITALIPVVLLPLMNVMKSSDICKNYLKDTNMLFIGGLLMAVAVEKWNLHKRIALGVLMIVGSKPKWLLFGFMITTAFLSMWLSNVATTAMMIPISEAMLSEMKSNVQTRRKSTIQAFKKISVIETNEDKEIDCMKSNDTGLDVISLADNQTAETETTNFCERSKNYPSTNANGIIDQEICDDLEIISRNSSHPQLEQLENENSFYVKFGKALSLCIAYSASIGGTATLTGTGPNIILQGQIGTLFGSSTGLNFGSWFIFAVPNMMVTLFFAWIWLIICFMGPKSLIKDDFKDKSANSIIKHQYKALGPCTWAEISTLILFITLALLWLLREPGFFSGWGVLFNTEKSKYVTDATAAITIALLLFIFPSRKPSFLSTAKNENTEPPTALLDWKTVNEKLPWNVILILGGGFALADACQVSGLSSIIGKFLISFGNLNMILLVFVLVTLTALFTEIASNTATATIFIPILAELCISLRIHPFYITMPITIATSLAFILPVATPPNAMVYAYGRLSILDMVKSGCIMNLLSILSVNLAINTWGYRIFHLDEFPDWADKFNNITTST